MDAELKSEAAAIADLRRNIAADLIVADGAETVAMMALQDPYGDGLLKFTKEPLEAAGVAVVTDFSYDPEAANFDSEVEEVTAQSSDAIVVIGFDETAQILNGLFENNVGNDQIYLVDPVAADSDSPPETAKNINAMTYEGAECTDFASCKELLEGGEDIAYVGPSGPN